MASGFLLDTHTFIWLASDDPRLSERARSVLLDAEPQLFLSVASVWEMAIKISLGKLFLGKSLEALVGEQVEQNSLSVLDVRTRHALGVQQLPWIHRDPFDRLLVSQALAELVPIVSGDEVFDRYPVERVW